MAISAKIVIVALFIATAATATFGLTVYRAHTAPLRALDDLGGYSPGSILDKYSYVEYSFNLSSPVRNETYKAKLYNNPEANEGRVELYRGDELLYTIRYTYEDEIASLERIDAEGNTTSLNLNETLQWFYTSIKLTLVGGDIVDIEPFAGAGPLIAAYFLTEELRIDWGDVLGQRQAGFSIVDIVQLVPVSTSIGDQEYRGVLVQMTGISPAFAPTVWALPTITMTLVKIGDSIIASSLIVNYVTQEGPIIISLTLDSIEFASQQG